MFDIVKQSKIVKIKREISSYYDDISYNNKKIECLDEYYDYILKTKKSTQIELENKERKYRDYEQRVKGRYAKGYATYYAEYFSSNKVSNILYNYDKVKKRILDKSEEN